MVTRRTGSVFTWCDTNRVGTSFITIPTGTAMEVNYIDYDEWMIPEDNICTPFLFKRESFKFENELRAMFMNIDSDLWREGTWP